MRPLDSLALIPQMLRQPLRKLVCATLGERIAVPEQVDKTLWSGAAEYKIGHAITIRSSHNAYKALNRA